MPHRSFMSFCLLLLPLCGLLSQSTTSGLSGRIASAEGEIMTGARVQLYHVPTGTAVFSHTDRYGWYRFSDLQPGGPYRLQALFPEFNSAEKDSIYLALGEDMQADLVLTPAYQPLQEVTVTGRRKEKNTAYAHVLTRDKLDGMPAISRGFHEYLAALPQARLVPGNEGAVSFAGQNNRYNTLFVDGAVNNDLFGLSASGTNGGQAGVSPIAMESIEQLQVAISPYDASLGNFTGAAINAITRSGGNAAQSSGYYMFRTSGYNGSAVSVSGTKAHSTGNTYGIRTSGPLRLNRLFYFMNVELERDHTTRPYDMLSYTGHADSKLLQLLRDNLRSNYGYDAGAFDAGEELLFTDRIVMRLDWRPASRHSISFSGRYMSAQRTAVPPGDAVNLYFSNSGYRLFSTNWSASSEWTWRTGRNSSNRCSVTGTWVTDDRGAMGPPFPRIRVYDGEASIVAGTDISSGVNLLQQRNIGISNRFTTGRGRHRLSAGIDMEYSHVYNAFIQYALGSYAYSSIDDLISNDRPASYQVGYSLLDKAPADRLAAAARFRVYRLSLFVNDDYRLGNRLTIFTGLRFDRYLFPDRVYHDKFITDSALPGFSQYYHLGNVIPGAGIRIAATISPRLFARYTTGNLVLRAGAGVFTGRMPFAWPGGVYQFNGSSTGGFVADKTQLNTIRFRPDPGRQWMPSDWQTIGNKDPLNFVGSPLHMPSLIRASLATDWQIAKRWNASAELMVSTTRQAIRYRNVNLLPPEEKTIGPGSRLVYSDSNYARIPFAGSANPYAYAIVLDNEPRAKGYAYEINLSLATSARQNWDVAFHYHWGHATVMNEGTSSVNLSQWRTIEAVNGRNNLDVSVSDFSSGHRFLVEWKKRVRVGTTRLTVTAVYQGQSGAPFSYVYGGNSLVRDDGRAGGYELMYVPLPEELAAMTAEPLLYKGSIITPDQQKQALEAYIGKDPYLRKRRGHFAERNGARMPFTHTVDAKITADLLPRKAKKGYRLQLGCELANLANLLNRSWGTRYALPFDQLSVLDFVDFAAPADKTPVFRATPDLFSGDPRKRPSQSQQAAYSAYWSCQLTVRANF